jgi:hypothetical protein
MKVKVEVEIKSRKSGSDQRVAVLCFLNLRFSPYLNLLYFFPLSACWWIGILAEGMVI